MGQGMVRVDRGDGKLFQFQAQDVKKFIDANPGAHIVDGFTPSPEPTEAEEAATAALNASPRRGRRSAASPAMAEAEESTEDKDGD